MAKRNTWKTFGMIMIPILMIVGVLAGLKYMGVLTFGGSTEEQLGQVIGEAVASASSTCPDTLLTATTLTLKNEEDDSKDDTFDATGYLYKVVGGVEMYDQSVADTTAGSVNLDCSQTYRLRLVSANADEGDNGIISSIVSSSDGKATLVDGGKAVEFTPVGRSYSVKVAGERHGVLQFKLWDNTAAGWACNSDDTCLDYEADGVSFTSTTNGTAKAIGIGEEIDVKVYFKSTKANTSFDDFGFYILLEGGASAATVWNEPSTVKLNGKTLQEYTLTGDESKQFDAYEYVYRVTDEDITDEQNILELVWAPNTGQNPSADVEIDFASIGSFLSVDGSTVKYGAARDDTSATVVFTVQDITYDIS